MCIKKNLFKIISIPLFITFFSICCFITYLIIKREQNPNYKLDSYISSLNSTYKLLDENIDSDDALETSLNNIQALQESKKNINTSLTLEDTKTFNHLIHASELYIKQLINLNDDMDNINENMVSLRDHFDDIIISLKSLPANSSLLNSTIYTITNLQTKYENKFYSEKINSISTDNLSSFISNLNSILYEFLPLIEDIDEKLDKARNNLYDYKLIINNLEKNLSICKNLKSELNKLPIPQKGIDLYHQMEEMLETYQEYNMKLKYSIKNEHLSDKQELNDTNLKKIYEDSDFIYSKLLNQYNILKHKIDSNSIISTSLCK